VAEFPQGIYTEAASTPRGRRLEHWCEHVEEVESALSGHEATSDRSGQALTRRGQRVELVSLWRGRRAGT